MKYRDGSIGIVYLANGFLMLVPAFVLCFLASPLCILRSLASVSFQRILPETTEFAKSICPQYSIFKCNQSEDGSVFIFIGLCSFLVQI